MDQISFWSYIFSFIFFTFTLVLIFEMDLILFMMVITEQINKLLKVIHSSTVTTFRFEIIKI